MKVSRNFLKRLIRESIDKQTKDLTKKAGADTPPEIASDFGGSDQTPATSDDFEMSEPIQTSRRSFMKLMASIGAALGIGGGAALVSKRRSASPLTDEELFQRAGFTKERNLYIPYAGYDGEPIDMGGHHYKKVQEILPGTNVTIKIHKSNRPDEEGMFVPSIGLQWSPTDNLRYIEDYDAFDVVGTASEVLEYIGGKGLNNIMDAYFKALQEKQDMALESIRRAEEVYQGHEVFDLNDKDNYNVYDTYGDGDLYYWWAHFIHAFGLPKRVWCAEGDNKPWFKLVEAGMQVDQLIDGKDIPVPPEATKGIMWAKTGTFNGKRVVIFQSFEVIKFSVFLD
jgi:hypothetical protein